MQEFLATNLDVITNLCRRHHVRRLSIFGSSIREDFDPARSDVDMRIEFNDDSHANYVENLHNLHDALIATLGRKVDILSADTIPNPVLRREIEQTQVTLYAA